MTSQAQEKRDRMERVIKSVADAAKRGVPFDRAWAEATDGFVKHVNWIKPDVRDLHEFIYTETKAVKKFQRECRAMRREQGVRTRAEQSKINKRKWASGARWE